MPASVAGIHLAGIHSARPAGNTVPDGSLYSCTTHSLIYKSDYAGNSWSTWATLGSGSGAVATDTIWDAKGDLAVGTGADTAAKLTVGANDTIPMADSAATTGIKWVGSQTPSTQAFSDAAAQGTADTYARGDHLHGMPASPGGGFTLVEHHAASASAQLDFTTGITSTYDVYEIVMVNCIPATDGVGFQMQVSTDGGATWLAGTTYNWNMDRTGANQTTNGAAMPMDGYASGLAGNTASYGGISGTTRLYNPLSATANKHISLEGAFQALDGTLENVHGVGTIATTSAINALRFKMSAGNFTGAVYLFALAKT